MRAILFSLLFLAFNSIAQTDAAKALQMGHEAIELMDKGG